MNSFKAVSYPQRTVLQQYLGVLPELIPSTSVLVHIQSSEVAGPAQCTNSGVSQQIATKMKVSEHPKVK